MSRSRAFNVTDLYAVADGFNQQPIAVAFPFGGDAIAEPASGPAQRGSTGNQTLTRLYGVTRLAVTDRLKAVLGVNAVKLHREGSSIYGSGGTVTAPNSQKASPYAGLTYDITPSALGYVSYSDIFQNQVALLFVGACAAAMARRLRGRPRAPSLETRHA